MKLMAITCAMMLSCGVSLAQVDDVKMAADSAKERKAPMNPQELMKKVENDRKEAMARIDEIDKKVNPVLEDTANRIFGIGKDEYAVLKMQSESRRSASYFSRRRNLDRDDLRGIMEYFNMANEALQNNDLWFGEEERLVQEDATLFNSLQTEILANVTQREDGSEILAMIEERKQLVSRLSVSQPLYRYLSERREWWVLYPEYVESLKDDVQTLSEYIGDEQAVQGNRGFGGGGRWSGGGRGR